VWNQLEQYLLFSDIAGDTIYKLVLPDGISVFRNPSNNSNGLAIDINGCLLAAEHGSRSVTCLQKDGALQTVASHYMNNKLHSPNDIAVRSDGTIYFTDPPYGLGYRQPELNFMGLYRLEPGGDMILEGRYNQYPNGVALSPDENTLYLALTEAFQVLALDVAKDGTLSNPRAFAEVPYPDGMAVDLAGNIYITGEDGVAVFDSNGTPLGTIQLSRQPANCAFAGQDGKTLIITARDCLYRVEVPIAGF
jgi:sugar lactone lactonase YvrE